MSLESTKCYCWQDQPEVRAMRDRRRSFGAWALILHFRRYLLLLGDDLTERQFDNVRATTEPRLEEHGEPPAAFVRCWLLDYVDTYGWIAEHGAGPAMRAEARREVDVARTMWREISREENAIVRAA